MKDTTSALVKEPQKFSIRRSWKKAAAAVSTASLAAFCSANSAMAQSDIGDLFTAVDISGAKTETKAFMILLIGIGLLFFGRSLLRRLGVSI